MKKARKIKGKCGECGHEPGFRRNVVGLKKWLCGCECHKHEVKHD